MFISIDIRNGSPRVRGSPQACLGTAAQRRVPWAQWSWDGTVLRAEVDRLGFQRLFHAAIDGGIALGDSITELLAIGAARDFDDGAIAAFLRLGFFLGEDTPFRGVRAFPPGGRLQWSAATGCTVTAQPVTVRTDHSIGRSEALAGYVELFRAAVRRSLPEEEATAALPLSGGRDSRHIALELHRCGFRPGMVLSQRHFPSRADSDAPVAAELAEALGWTLVVQPQTPRPAVSEMEKNHLAECVTIEHGWFMPGAREISRRHLRHVFDGIAGDVLSNGLFCRPAWFEAAQRGDLPGLFDQLARSAGADEQACAHLLPAPLARRWSRELAYARWSAEMGRYLQEEDPPSRFMFWNRTRRCIAPFYQCLLPGVQVLMPYLDEQVFDHLWSLPRALMEGRNFHDQAIALAAPEFAGIGYERKQPAPDPQRHHAALVRGLAQRREALRFGQVVNRRWLWPRLLAARLSENRARDAGWYANWAAWLLALEQLAGTRPA